MFLTTAVALWLSTIASYRGSEDVQQFIMLAIVVAAGASAIYSIGAQRAFWGGFSVTMLLVSARAPLPAFSPRFTWVSELSTRLARYLGEYPAGLKHHMQWIHTSIVFTAYLAIAAMLGLMCVYIFHRFNKKQIED